MELTALDYEGIRQLMARYVQALDFGRVDDFVNTFAPDGSFEVLGIPDDAPHKGAHAGAEALRKLGEMFRDGLKGHCRHWNPQPVIEPIDATHARMTSYLCVFRAGEAPYVGAILTGFYWDEVVKIDGKWVFQKRVVQADMQPEHDQEPTDVLVVRRDDYVRKAMGL